MFHPFSIVETLKVSWGVLKKNVATIAVYTILSFSIIIGTGFVVKFILIDLILGSVGVIISIFLVSFLFLGFIKLIFRLIDKEYYDFEFKDIVPTIKMLFSYIILLVIVSTLAVFVTNAFEKLPEGLLQSCLGILSGLFIEIFFLFYFPICAC